MIPVGRPIILYRGKTNTLFTKRLHRNSQQLAPRMAEIRHEKYFHLAALIQRYGHIGCCSLWCYTPKVLEQ